MRIDNASGTKAWLIGKFSGSFKGDLEGAVSFAKNACQAATASYIGSRDLGVALDEALNDPENEDVLKRLIYREKLVVAGGIRVLSGSVDIDSGSLRIKKVRLEYDDDEDALNFKFVGSEPPEPPIPPVPPEPPVPPVPPPPPPYPPYPPYPPPFPPRPPFDCNTCPLSSSCYAPPTGSSGSVKPKVCQYSIDYYREGRY